jgi:hypothetical protein
MSSTDLNWMVGDRVRAISPVEPACWFFELASGGTLRVETLWRVVAGGRVEATSADHGHRFGLPEPVDSGARAKLALSDARVRRASIIHDTGDVVVDFDNDSRLEILTISGGYEGWSIVSPTRDEIIGLGGGLVDVRKRDG